MGRFDPDAEGKGRYMAALAYDASLLVKDSALCAKAKSKEVSAHTTKWLNFRGDHGADVWGFEDDDLKLLNNAELVIGMSR